MIPDLWSSYKKFCDIRDETLREDILDMSGLSWIHLMTLQPLVGHIMSRDDDLKAYRPPRNEQVASYIRLMLSKPRDLSSPEKTYVPNFLLTRNQSDANRVISRLCELQDNGRSLGGRNVFMYLLGELIDNIYEHSSFVNAMVAAQRYDKAGFVEVSFYDDGITIARSLRDAGHVMPTDCEAIRMAVVHGLSSKKDVERGYGLYTNMNLCTSMSGLAGKVLIVSGKGAIGHGPEMSDRYVFNFNNNYYWLSGTLVSIRIPFTSKEVDLYDFTG